MYEYHQNSYEAHERGRRRRREAEAERIIRQARAGARVGWPARLAGAAERLIPARREAARLRTGA